MCLESSKAQSLTQRICIGKLEQAKDEKGRQSSDALIVGKGADGCFFQPDTRIGKQVLKNCTLGSICRIEAKVIPNGKIISPIVEISSVTEQPDQSTITETRLRAVTVMLTGKCTQLSVLNKDFTAKCTGMLMNFTHANGRVGFHFSAANGAVFGFVGWKRNEIRVDESTMLQPLDGLLFDRKGSDSDNYKATGECRYTNKLKGEAQIRCIARTREGPVSAIFISDGHPRENFSN
jgi:hypothetical protein